MVCDGIADCPSNDDESECNNVVKCPGLLRCKLDDICVHPDNICDGITHCVQSGDDEYLCGEGTCIPECHCTDCMVYCHNTHVKTFSTLPDYTCALIIEASSFGIGKSMFKKFTNLIHVALTNITFEINKVPVIMLTDLISLRTLDISHSNIEYIQSNSFTNLHFLYYLDIRYNAIHTIHTNAFRGLISVVTLDLSNINLRFIYKCGFCGLDNIIDLNISNNYILHFEDSLVRGMNNIVQIDITGNPIISVQTKISKISQLEILLLDNIDFCCYLHHKIHCKSINENSMKKCEHVFYSKKQMTIFLLVAGIILLSNLFSFLFQFFSKNSFEHIAVLVPNSIIGFYPVIIYAAHYYYDNEYAYDTESWTNTLPCRTTAIVLVASYLMSKFGSLQYVLTHFIVVKYPFLKYMSLVDRYIIIYFICQMILCVTLATCWIIFFPTDSLLCLPWDHVSPSAGVISFSVCLLFIIPMCINIAIAFLNYKIIAIIRHAAKQFNHKYTNTKKLRQQTIVKVILNTCSCFLLTSSVFINMLDKPANPLINLWTNLSSLFLSTISLPALSMFQHCQTKMTLGGVQQ